MNSYRIFAGQFSQSFHVFKLSGEDVDSFLSNQSSFDTTQINIGSFHLASFLDPQGRIECYGWLAHAKDYWLYLVPEQLKDHALERLNRFLISEDVTIEGPIWEDWTCIVGSEAFAKADADGFKGEMFGDHGVLQRKTISPAVVKVIPDTEMEVWQGLTGWPDFKADHFQKELITNTRHFDLSVSMNKGCYPGQETVSKIATRRGAAYSPVLLETTKNFGPGTVSNFGNRIGEAFKTFQWKDKFYVSASLLRDFRVEGMKLVADINGEQGQFVVRYFPFLAGTDAEKAQELFYEATDFFMKGNEESAEESFKLSLKLDPHHADSLESLGVLLGRNGRFEEAIEWMKKLSESHPSNVLAHTNMSVYLMKLGKIEEAEEQKSMATVKSFQKFGAEAKEKELLEAEKKKKAEEWIKRESMFIQVLEIDEEDTLANYGIGSIAVEKGEWSRARTHLEKVIKADPKYSVAYLALGKAYASLGDKDLARSTFREGIKVAAAKGDLMPANQMQFELDRLN